MSVNIYDDTQGTLTRVDGKAANPIVIVSVTFTSAGYGLWTASTKTTHRILQAVVPNYFIVGDGSDYCGLIKRTSSSVEPAPATDSPITMDCLAILKA